MVPSAALGRCHSFAFGLTVCCPHSFGHTFFMSLPAAPLLSADQPVSQPASETVMQISCHSTAAPVTTKTWLGRGWGIVIVRLVYICVVGAKKPASNEMGHKVDRSLGLRRNSSWLPFLVLVWNASIFCRYPSCTRLQAVWVVK